VIEECHCHQTLLNFDKHIVLGYIQPRETRWKSLDIAKFHCKERIGFVLKELEP